MTSWEATLKKLRKKYQSRSLLRLTQIQSLVTSLRSHPDDQQALDQLMRHFHSLAGSGGSYGFPLVSQLAEQGECECGDYLNQKQPLQEEVLFHWEELLKQLHAEFSNEVFSNGNTSKITRQEALFHILILEYPHSFKNISQRLLDQEGFCIHTVSTKGEALQWLEKQLPHGMIVNTVLPDGSGYELIEQIRSIPNGDNPTILLISDDQIPLDRVKSISCGADSCFEMPLNLELVVERLQQLIHKGQKAPGRILSVEDDPDQAEFISMILESAGYKIQVCSHPKSFEEDLNSFGPDLLLMDVILPEISGFDLVRYLRKNERYATLPIVFLTTQGHLQAKIESVKSGGDDHLTKPVLAGLLLSTIAARIERSHLLKSLLSRDSLTMLLTHSAFLERAKKAIFEKQRNPKKSSALIMIDLDHFKAVNDRYGHPVGDQVLVSLSTLLRKRMRQYDAIGRYGGEEFIILLEDLHENETVRLAVRLLEEFSSIPHRAYDGQSFLVTFSAGIAMLQASMTIESWKKAVDDALYLAKTQGRNRIVVAEVPQTQNFE